MKLNDVKSMYEKGLLSEKGKDCYISMLNKYKNFEDDIEFDTNETKEVIAMKVKTTTQIFNDCIEGITHSPINEDIELKWVKVEDVINWIDKLRKSNDMWRYAVDDCFGMLEDAITSDSEPNGSTHKKDLTATQLVASPNGDFSKEKEHNITILNAIKLRCYDEKRNTM